MIHYDMTESKHQNLYIFVVWITISTNTDSTFYPGTRRAWPKDLDLQVGDFLGRGQRCGCGCVDT